MNRLRLAGAGSTPPPAPLEMPTQSLRRAPKARFPVPSANVVAARLVAFGGGAAIAGYGFVQMRLVFGNETQTTLQDVLLALFTITFGWIAFSATQALAGLFWRPPPEPQGAAPKGGRVALVMPVYNEDPAETCGALLSMGRALAAREDAERYEIFILSDTRDPDMWLRETAAVAALRRALAGSIPVWYRRRSDNAGKKAGNLREFVERWGARYDYMLVLDADSLMSAATISELADRMDRSPHLGILQTVPMLAGGETLFARLQQFAGRLYGPAIANGVSAWQGLDGNYWGHNALIRVRAFAQSCGLPELPGRRPWGGHVMSHDFVEAALIRRAGWEVRMDPDLRGSFEGAPPSLLDLAARDRRWAQGNLQHAKILTARRLRWPNRAHFVIGIGAYLMSPIWLLLLATGLTLTAQALMAQPQYFPDARQLFPNWPVFDAARMRWLFALAMALLLLPKFMGLGRALIRRRTRRRFGGALKVTAGALAEVLLSALYAPILMLTQAHQVWEILLGKDSGWAPQSRAGEALPWGAALRRHWRHVAAGAIPGAALAWFAPEQLIWFSPVLAGLLIAPALSRWSGDPRAGQALRRLGLLVTPEEISTPAVARRAESGRAAIRSACGARIVDLAEDPSLLHDHLSALDPAQTDVGEAERLARITAGAKIAEAPSRQTALDWMTRDERLALLSSPDLLSRFAEGVDAPAAGRAAGS